MMWESASMGLLASACLALAVAPAVAAEPGPPQDPQKYLQQRMNNPLLKCQGTMTGEGVCWHAAHGAGEFLAGFRRTGDAGWLDAAQAYFDALIAKLHLSPDGYRGWVGPFIYNKELIADVHVGDAILVNPMLEFAETVLKSPDAALKAKYEAKAREYVALAKRDLIEKWDVRGTWLEDGPYGAYIGWNKYMTAGRLDAWQDLADAKSGISLPFNKQNDMAIASLRIYRITGEEPYRQRALRIFLFQKSRMCLFDDHYAWNYWEPYYPGDVDDQAPNSLHHWVNVHGYRNYQAGEVHQIVEAYHSGLAFTEEDMRRIVNTNLKAMWNGDREKPQWRNSNYAVLTAAFGQPPEVKPPPGGKFDKLAGCLWSGLADFDATIRELGKIRRETPPSFARKHSELPATTLDFPFRQSRFLVMAAALTAEVKRGAEAVLVSKSRVPGKIAVTLYDDAGQKELQTIYAGETTGGTDGREGILIVRWKAEVEPGAYRVRWTFQDECREFAISVR